MDSNVSENITLGSDTNETKYITKNNTLYESTCLEMMNDVVTTKSKVVPKTSHEELNEIEYMKEYIECNRTGLAMLPSFKCSICGLLLEDLGEFESHLASHSESVSSYSELKLVDNPKGPATDPVPKKKLPRLFRESKRVYVCGHCGVKYPHVSGLRKHVATHPGYSPNLCCTCGSDFPDIESLVEHCKKTHRERPHVCDQCGWAFTIPGNLRKHMRIHTGEKPFQCEECERTFVCISNLNAHKKKHSGERPFKCTVCFREFGAASTLERHLRTHSGDRPFECGMCGMTFAIVGNLRKHERIHSGERRFICDVCHISFLDSGALKCHLRTHTGEKPFSCALCRRMFSNKSALRVHKRTHTGEKPFKCSVCDASFGSPSGRKKHVKTVHSTERPYACELCGAAFKGKCSLKQHMQTHNSGKNSEKKYECNVCHIKYASSQTLKYHLLSHTDEKPFVCGECGKAFAHKSNLWQHRRTHAGEKSLFSKDCKKKIKSSTTVTCHQGTHTSAKAFPFEGNLETNLIVQKNCSETCEFPESLTDQTGLFHYPGILDHESTKADLKQTPVPLYCVKNNMASPNEECQMKELFDKQPIKVETSDVPNGSEGLTVDLKEEGRRQDQNILKKHPLLTSALLFGKIKDINGESLSSESPPSISDTHPILSSILINTGKDLTRRVPQKIHAPDIPTKHDFSDKLSDLKPDVSVSQSSLFMEQSFQRSSAETFPGFSLLEALLKGKVKSPDT